MPFAPSCSRLLHWAIGGLPWLPTSSVTLGKLQRSTVEVVKYVLSGDKVQTWFLQLAISGLELFELKLAYLKSENSKDTQLTVESPNVALCQDA